LLLQATKIDFLYGNVPVLIDISLSVLSGEIVSVIGSNGSGKSTLLKTIAGHKYPKRGMVTFEGRDVTFTPPWHKLSLGLAFVPEERQLFGGLSVQENLFLGVFPIREKVNKQVINKYLDAVYYLFPRLNGKRSQSAKTLSGGEQQMLAIGRGLMSNPRLLLIDELSLGLAPLVRKDIYDTLLQLNNEEGKTVLLVEQDIKECLRISNRGYLMQTGSIVCQGTAQELLGDPAVKSVYLGEQ
jgi:branched-chain amino acid transport system ATP-binding protein